MPNRRAPDFPHQVRRLSSYASCDMVRLVLLLTEPTHNHVLAGSAQRAGMEQGGNEHV